MHAGPSRTTAAQNLRSVVAWLASFIHPNDLTLTLETKMGLFRSSVVSSGGRGEAFLWKDRDVTPFTRHMLTVKPSRCALQHKHVMAYNFL